MATLVDAWRTLYTITLPNLAKLKSSAQTHWPVQADHCFARIILDSVIGRGEEYTETSSSVTSTENRIATPWTERLKSPAIKNMTEAELSRCVTLGEAIAGGKANLVELDERSLAARGKAFKTSKGHGKRKGDAKIDDTAALSQPSSSEPKPKLRRRDQPDIRAAFGAPPKPSASSVPSASIDSDLRDLIETSEITAFRKRVLLALCQVPKGQVSTYLALSEYLNSAPRAVGNALRNNPFAPRVPCHRIVAANKTIGGFNGSWGVKGEYFNNKVTLLKEEGVRVNEKDGRIGNTVWTGFE
ncbi:uncharacterized protein KY384_008351 [Bacidia gigantensis]|uniref:uncharacterized protein n=1 Tax=Bacidia gigantensis TaxID=2732470 RepID=UPI001D038C44|nr:uncharacterized protein KY384_008351 [Bacidia gigantensis]KAG8526922.1 hypothetical protein KY384_008351 [Bacidia gigantensis]